MNKLMMQKKNKDFVAKRHKLEICKGTEVTMSQYRNTVREINKLKSVDEALALAETNDKACCVFRSKKAECDCNYQ